MFSKIKSKLKTQPVKNEKPEPEKKSRPISRRYSTPPPLSGGTKFSQDMTTLVNNAYGSDVQFKVGGGDISTLQENGETTYDESATVTLFAHSLILRCRSRYFATMLNEEKKWKESSNGVIYKPNISPSTFQDVLYYIYTGNVPTKSAENVIDLIAAADEMELEELGIECQTQLLHKIENILFDDYDSGEEGEDGEILEGSVKQHVPLHVAIRTHIVPALNLANKHSLSHLSQKLLTFVVPYMPTIIDSPDAYAAFIDKISSDDLAKIIASDNLAITERNIWDLALNWACQQTNLSKGSVEALLNKYEDNEELNELKTILAPVLPVIRFSLLLPDDYAQMINYLSFFLPRYRCSELNRYFINTNDMERLDAPRIETLCSKIIDSSMWRMLRKHIHKTGGIHCPSSCDLKFDLLFRASVHGFLTSTFHQRCDNKGPTIVLIKSADGHLFGGVNFNPWKSETGFSSSGLNFLFALPDGRHRRNLAIFPVEKSKAMYSSYNYSASGPAFGCPHDLVICDSANINQTSYSSLPASFNGSGASNTVLAGAKNFTISDYEVFSISK